MDSRIVPVMPLHCILLAEMGLEELTKLHGCHSSDTSSFNTIEDDIPLIS